MLFALIIRIVVSWDNDALCKTFNIENECFND